jgi:serine/threonine protein kinase
VVVLLAAVAGFMVRRRLRQRYRQELGGTWRRKANLHEPLMATSNMQNQEDVGPEGSVELHHSGTNTGGSGVQVPPVPVDPADFEAVTGAPINVSAKKELAQEWNTAARMGVKARVVELPYSELEAVTQGFSELNNVGDGASCAVFRCYLFGIPVAVKQLKDTAVEWEAKQFASEMQLLSSVSHPNICRLLAFSVNGAQRCLVLDLCAGGALNSRLSCKASAGCAPHEPLTWQQRVHIAHGIACALEHLHGLTPQMIHRDLKVSARWYSALPCRFRTQYLLPVFCCFNCYPVVSQTPNVMLDDRNNAKVADFGTVREGVRKGSGRTKGAATHTWTAAAVGTHGYMPRTFALPHTGVPSPLSVVASSGVHHARARERKA